MKTFMALLALFICALPASAEKAERHVVAVCELATATVVPSGKAVDGEGHEFAVRVNNKSPRTVAVPKAPAFGWRVEILEKKDWRLKAEGGPVRLLRANDQHVAVFGEASSAKSEDSTLIQIAPAQSETLYTAVPEAEKALQTAHQFSKFRLTLYWAAPAGLANSNSTVLPCALAAEWIVDVQKPAPK
jgi:hypothetical protein